MATFEEIRNTINAQAVGRPLGEIQNLRKSIHQMQRKGSQHVFGDIRGITSAPGSDTLAINEYPYVYHVGGREELQFNFGIDPFGDDDLRYGVAFSFEPSVSYPSIDPLLPKVQLFNDYLRQNPAEFAGTWMWHYTQGERSERRRPAPITPEIVQSGNFVFMGELARSEEPPYPVMLDLFDRLMPLWFYIETNCIAGQFRSAIGRILRRGRPQRRTFASVSLAERHLDINLRHNVLQARLINELIDEFGESAVGWEEPADGGGMIDAMVMLPARTMLYEIKTAATARGCIREALGQLLDYAFWPGTSGTTHLYVVGEPALDATTACYLTELNARFPAPISYRQILVGT